LTINANSKQTKLINCRSDSDVYTDNSISTEVVGGGITSSAIATRLIGFAGHSNAVNFFHNPYNLIWPGGASAAPAGWSIVSGSFAKDTTTKYPGNPGRTSIAVTSTATTLNDMVRAIPLSPAYLEGDVWVSVTVPVYVAAGQPNVKVFLFTGLVYEEIQEVTAKDTWVVARGSALNAGGYVPTVVVAPFNSGYVSGDFLVGGLNVAWGTSAPKHLQDCGRMQDYVVPNVSHPPAFVGQKAYVSGTGKWYLAANTTSSADWIILN